MYAATIAIKMAKEFVEIMEKGCFFEWVCVSIQNTAV